MSWCHGADSTIGAGGCDWGPSGCGGHCATGWSRCSCTALWRTEDLRHTALASTCIHRMLIARCPNSMGSTWYSLDDVQAIAYAMHVCMVGSMLCFVPAKISLHWYKNGTQRFPDERCCQHILPIKANPLADSMSTHRSLQLAAGFVCSH